MAIAFDSFNQASQTPGSSQTLAHTGTGSNLAAVVLVLGGTSDTVTGCTYDGSAMTLKQKIVAVTDGNNFYEYYFYLSNVNAGTVNVVASASGSDIRRMYIGTYSGVASGAADNSVKVTLQGPSSTPSVSLTTNTDNCWIAAFFSENGSGQFATGTNYTERSGVAGAGRGFGDTNSAQTPAGSKTLTSGDIGESGVYIAVAVSFAPLASGPANLKTTNGLAKASIKTINGLAIGSIKTFNGLT